ncbi:MAG: hypothetical protein JSS49_05365 [Planctomycetes bacterium]|nr:hypothetical protein [Planctomycetota bacterium]
MMTQESKRTLPYTIDWLSNLIAEDQVFEIRGLGQHKYSGFFDYAHIKDAAVAALNLSDQKNRSGQWECHGVYWTLNPLDPSVLSRRANRIAYVGKDFATARDADVIRRRWILVDCDPVRTAGVSSAEDELVAAFDMICDVREHLRTWFTVDPVWCESGNGFHLLYRVDMPNDDAATKTVKDLLRYLADRFDTARAKIDTSVFNAGRICKLYGTVSRKGDSTVDRPHRRAGVSERRHAGAEGRFILECEQN